MPFQWASIEVALPLTLMSSIPHHYHGIHLMGNTAQLPENATTGDYARIIEIRDARAHRGIWARIGKHSPSAPDAHVDLFDIDATGSRAASKSPIAWQSSAA